jgi:hypothetical protein
MAKERKLTVEEVATRLNKRKDELEERYQIWIHSIRWNWWMWLIYEGYEEVTEIISPDWIDYRLEDWKWIEDL